MVAADPSKSGNFAQTVYMVGVKVGEKDAGNIAGVKTHSSEYSDAIGTGIDDK